VFSDKCEIVFQKAGKAGEVVTKAVAAWRWRVDGAIFAGEYA